VIVTLLCYSGSVVDCRIAGRLPFRYPLFTPYPYSYGSPLGLVSAFLYDYYYFTLHSSTVTSMTFVWHGYCSYYH